MKLWLYKGDHKTVDLRSQREATDSCGSGHQESLRIINDGNMLVVKVVIWDSVRYVSKEVEYNDKSDAANVREVV